MDWIKKVTNTRLWGWAMDVVAGVEWPRVRALINGGLYYTLEERDHDMLRHMLRTDYYVIITHRRTTLSSWLITIADWILTGKRSQYSHVLINTEGDIEGHIGFKLLEATSGTNLGYTTFMKAFDCDAVALLVPKGVTPAEWTAVIDAAKAKIGTPYDSLFDLANAERMSCVEVIYWGLQQLPDFEERFPTLLRLIREGTNLTPQMFYDSDEFEVVYEVRR